MFRLDTFKVSIGWILVTMVALMVFAKVTFGYSEQQSDAKLLLKVMKDSGITLQETELTSSNLIRDKQLDDIPSIKNRVERAFGMKLNRVEHTEGHDMIELQGQKVLSSTAALQVKLTGRTNQGQFRLYLLTKLALEQNGQKDFKYYRKLNQYLRNLELKPEIGISIKGTLGSKLSHNEQYNLLLSMFKKLEGEVKEGLNQEKVISLTGYSKTLHGYVMSQNEKVNLQIASNYDSLYKKTIITIGSPIITMEY